MAITNQKNTLLQKTSKFVTQLFEKELPNWAVYHDLNHTLETVEGCLEIGKGSDLNDEDLEILLIAAWFHDTGYTLSWVNHEERSAAMAKKFLRGM